MTVFEHRSPDADTKNLRIVVVTATVSNRIFRVRGTRIYIGIRLVILLLPQGQLGLLSEFQASKLTNFFVRLLYTGRILWFYFTCVSCVILCPISACFRVHY